MIDADRSMLFDDVLHLGNIERLAVDAAQSG